MPMRFSKNARRKFKRYDYLPKYVSREVMEEMIDDSIQKGKAVRRQLAALDPKRVRAASRKPGQDFSLFLYGEEKSDP